METKIFDFRTSFYIPAIQKLAFHLPYVRILGKNNCGAVRRASFKQRELFKDVLCHRDYYESLVASFDHKIQSEYCGGNISVSIKGIVSEHFSALPKADINSTRPSRKIHAVSHYFLSCDSKQDAATTTAHSKRLISLLKDKNY